MSRKPVNPQEYGGDWDEARLAREDYATGLDVWDPVTKAYQNFLGDGDMANAQLWSLRQAIRLELLDEMQERALPPQAPVREVAGHRPRPRRAQAHED